MNFKDSVSCISADFKRNIFIKSKFVLVFFRICHFLSTNGFLLFLLASPIIILYILIVEWILCIEIPVKTKIGKGFVIYHGYGLVINGFSVIGENVSVRQGCCIGNKIAGDGRVSGAPVIGNRVELGVNSVLLGDIVIADDVTIGAGAVVTKNCNIQGTYVGVPARLIK